MNKRSYLDTLNAGRQRRPHSTLDELSRSLQHLEEQIGMPRAEPRQPLRDSGRMPETGLYAPRATEEPRYPPRGGYERPQPAPARAPAARQSAYDDGFSADSRISGELRSLREELRSQMTTGIRREFDSLRKEIERAFQASPAARGSAELGLEVERLSNAIHTLSDRGDDKGVHMLRLELEQVKGAIETLAREETLLSVDRRWEDFDRRMSAFQERVSADVRQRAADPAIAALTERLEQISSAVNGLPESLSLRSLEDKVRTLAGAVDHFSRQERSGPSFDLIEERLDEISRAIVATTVTAQAPQFDIEPFERIEARITALARQIEEVSGQRPGDQVYDRLDVLSDRVDQIAQRIESGSPGLDTEAIFRGIEQRFDVLAGMIERRQGDQMEQANLLFRDLERRLDEVADRLDRPAAMSSEDGIMNAIDQRFADFARKLDSRKSGDASDAKLQGLESRLDAISTKLSAAPVAPSASMDPAIIRSLESQVAELSAHLAKPSQPGAGIKEIAPRLDQIEKSIAGNRDSILDAARQAAESAVRNLGPQADSAAAFGLTDDLKALESLTRRSEERNTRTFEAIHDTLLKIVDRLGTLDRGPAEPAPKMALQNPPSLDMDRPLPLQDAPSAMPPADKEKAGRSPAEAAAAAAVAALDDDEQQTDLQPKAKRSMLGGLARAFSRKDREEPQLAGSTSPVEEAPEIALDEPLDPKAANRPLEPGSGAPDISAIVKRVRDERGQPVRQPRDADAAKSDFIAAARRAAQAAAAEAEVLKRQSDVRGAGGKSKLGDLLSARRKPILMAAAAIMIALAGLQLSKAFFAEQAEVVSVEPAPPAQTMSAETMAAEGIAAVDTAPADQADEQTSAMETAPLSVEAPAMDAPEDAATVADPVRVVDQPAPAASTDLVAQAAPQVSTPEPTAPAAADPEQPVETASVPAAAEAIEIPLDAGPVPLREAAATGDSKALFEIGSRYAEGRGVKSDMTAAAKWYEKSAELGFAPGQYRIGNFYEKGLGVERDIAKAKTWYQLSAGQGNASAMHNLAVLFAMGADGTTDNNAAARWFTDAAELGVKDSQFNLGILSAKGVGMPQNLEESYKWFALVAKTGDRDAATKRDEVANSLRPEQLERARATVELWKPKPLDAEANTVEIPDSWQESQGKTASVPADIDMKQVVLNIQRILNKNGYDAGGADGVMGQKTKTAIAAFQQDNGLDATGEVDEKLVKLLLERK